MFVNVQRTLSTRVERTHFRVGLEAADGSISGQEVTSDWRSVHCCRSARTLTVTENVNLTVYKGGLLLKHNS